MSINITYMKLMVRVIIVSLKTYSILLGNNLYITLWPNK
jgi:hypothetical protein